MSYAIFGHSQTLTENQYRILTSIRYVPSKQLFKILKSPSHVVNVQYTCNALYIPIQHIDVTRKLNSPSNNKRNGAFSR
jgi:hypothetical protein